MPSCSIGVGKVSTLTVILKEKLWLKKENLYCTMICMNEVTSLSFRIVLLLIPQSLSTIVVSQENHGYRMGCTRTCGLPTRHWRAVGMATALPHPMDPSTHADVSKLTLESTASFKPQTFISLNKTNTSRCGGGAGAGVIVQWSLLEKVCQFHTESVQG